MARALVVTHTDSEQPGWFGEWLPAAGLALEVNHPYAGEPLGRLDGYDALVVLGGPMGADDEDSVPWLAGTKQLLRDAVAAGLPTLGICLGAQLLADACGGRVDVAPDGPELGVRLLAKRDAAAADPVLAGVAFTPPAVQWHFDAVLDLPPGAVLLARSNRYDNQAFRVGERAWGFQFHPEAPPELVAQWAALDENRVRGLGLDPDALVARVRAESAELQETWRPVAEAFARVVTG